MRKKRCKEYGDGLTDEQKQESMAKWDKEDIRYSLYQRKRPRVLDTLKALED